MKKLTLKKMNIGVYISAVCAATLALAICVTVLLFEMGFLQSRQTELVIRTASSQKTYDGEPLQSTEYWIVGGELKEEHQLVIARASSQLEIGECENGLEFVVRDRFGTDVSNHYKIILETGTLTVNRPKLRVRLATAQKMYDGTPLTNDTFSLVGYKPLKGHSVHVYGTPSLTDVGTMPNAGIVRVLDALGNDVTDVYDLQVEDGTLEVVGRPITIRTDNATKTYDGLPLLAAGYTISRGELEVGHTLRAQCTGSQTDAGKGKNTLTYSIVNALGRDVSGQYDVTVETGELTVLPQPIYVKTESANKVYDGKPVSNSQYAITSGTLAAGERLRVVSSTSLTKAGTVDNVITFAVVDGAGKDVSHRYQIQLAPGKLTVEPRAITILTGSAEKRADGKPLTCNTWSLQMGSFVSGDTLRLVGASRSVVGVMQNVPTSVSITGVIDGRSTDVSDCYRITYSYGTLCVTP